MKKESFEQPHGRRHFLKTLACGSGSLLFRGAALAGPMAAGFSNPARAAGTTVFDPLVDPTLQGFTEHTSGPGGSWRFDLAPPGLFQITAGSMDQLYYSKPFSGASGAVSLSCYVQVGTGATSAGSVGAFFALDAGLTGTGHFAGRVDLCCGYALDAIGLLRPVLGMFDQNGQFSHTVHFDWKAGGAFSFGRNAVGDAFLNVPGEPSLSVPAAQLSGPFEPEPTFAFGCPVVAAGLLASFGAIEIPSAVGVTVPSISGPLLPAAIAAAGYMALRGRSRRED